jgi:hypothetical protein
MLPEGSRAARSASGTRAYQAAAAALRAGENGADPLSAGRAHQEAAASHDALAADAQRAGDRAGFTGHTQAAAIHRAAATRCSSAQATRNAAVPVAAGVWPELNYEELASPGLVAALRRSGQLTGNADSVHSFDTGAQASYMTAGAEGVNPPDGDNPDEVYGVETELEEDSPQTLLDRLLRGAAGGPSSHDGREPAQGQVGYQEPYSFGRSTADQGTQASPWQGYRDERFQVNQAPPRPVSAFAAYANQGGLLMNQTGWERDPVTGDIVVEVSASDRFGQGPLDLIANETNPGRGVLPDHAGGPVTNVLDIDGNWSNFYAEHRRNLVANAKNIEAKRALMEGMGM